VNQGRGAEDFVANTLDKIQGMWPRLIYLAKLRAPGRASSHWGLEQTYGRETADEILASTHERLFSSILGTRLQRLESEVPPAIAAAVGERAGYFQRLHELAPALTPDSVSPAALLHFDLILDYLSALAEADSEAA